MKEPSKAAITAAWITGLLGCIGVTLAAIIGLGLPVVQRWIGQAELTPVIIVVPTTAPQPEADVITLDTPTSSPIPPIMSPSPTIMPQPSPPLSLEPQRVRWGPVDGRKAGICINSCDDEFIPWVELKEEIELRLLPQVSNVPSGSTVTLKDLKGKQDWIVQIIGPRGNEIGHVWFGPNPSNDWAFDGLVRVGVPSVPAVVWDTFQRYPDGSYRKQ